MSKIITKCQSGQALITLLFFMVIALTVTTSAIIVLLTTSTTASNSEQGIEAYYTAETGIENGLIRLLRNQNYSGETLNIGDAKATIEVVNGNPIIITSTGEAGNSKRKIQAEVVYNNNKYTVTSWKEIY